MERLLETLKKNCLVLSIGLAVSLIVLLPHLELIFSLGDDYQGIPIAETDNDQFYNSRARDVYDGHFWVKSPRVFWPDARFAMIPALGEAMIAGIAKLGGMSFGSVPLVANFLFAFLSFLILFVLFNKLSGSRLVAMLSAAGVILASNLAFFPRQLLSIVQDFKQLSPSIFNRPVIPQVGIFMFFLFALLFYQYLKNKEKGFLIASGVLFGLLFYTYLYAWTFATVLLGWYLIISAWQKDYRGAKSILLILLIGLGISALFWINYFQVSSLPVYEDMQKRFGFITSRTPMWSTLLFLDAIFILIMARLRKGFDENLKLVLVFIMSGFTLINQQVITSYRFFPGHWHWYFIVPISFFVFIWFGYVCAGKLGWRFFKMAFAAVVTIVIFANGFLSQHAYFLNHREQYADFQRYGKVYKWIDQNAGDAVILVNNQATNELSERLTTHTSAYSYLPNIADREYLIAQEYFRHAYFVSLFLEGKRNPETDIVQDDIRLMTVLFGFYNWYQNKCRACYTLEEIRSLKDDYAAFLERDFAVSLKSYKIDYALWDTNLDRSWNLDAYDFLKPLAEINGVKIYSVI